jgi:hypothetical protein
MDWNNTMPLLKVHIWFYCIFKKVAFCTSCNISFALIFKKIYNVN